MHYVSKATIRWRQQTAQSKAWPLHCEIGNEHLIITALITPKRVAAFVSGSWTRPMDDIVTVYPPD